MLCLCGYQVAVHLNCYRSVKESTGPWYCELCEELPSLTVPRDSLDNSSGTPNSSVECGLCGLPNGAFRKSINGQWVHAFCAEVKYWDTVCHFVIFFDQGYNEFLLFGVVGV